MARPSLARPRRRGLAVIVAAVTGLAVAATAYLLVAGRGGERSNRPELWASAERDLDPVLVPRRHPPRVVEPVAGDVGGVATPVAPDPTSPPAKGEGEEEGGPPEGVPSDTEVRRELAKLEAAKRRYDFEGLDFSGQLIPFDALPGDGWRQSIASVYYDFDQGLACGGLLRPEQLGVAHKTAPCGTLVTFRYGDRAIRVPVIDRGPYIIGREWDFTAATAAALGFPGLGVIEWHV